MILIDIFCDVIDNYGDAGVCLHLARNLSHQDYQVRLFCNNLEVLNTIINEHDKSNNKLAIVNWEQPLTTYRPSQVVISAFNCRFDKVTTSSLQEAQKLGNTIIINLEYLSAESWVEDCHGLTSFVDNLSVYYFFPGFTNKTGALNVDKSFKQKCLITLQKLKKQLNTPPTTFKERTFSLFGYHNTIIKDLLNKCNDSKLNSKFLVFEGLALDNLINLTSCTFNKDIPTHLSDNITVKVMPMVPHEQYDDVLLSCDFNLVRGEDSIVRAMHTGHPFLWHIYPQDENAHLIKLQSFLERMKDICLNEIPKMIGTSGAPDYLTLDASHIQRACELIESTMMAYNSKESFDKNFNLDDFVCLSAPIYYNFACYLCHQRDLSDSLNAFIQSKLQ